MFFVPIVIQYTAVEEVTLNLGEFTADLDVPASAKPGDSFNVVDKSAFYDTSEFACTQLSYSVDSGSSKPVAGWKGTELGESISQSFADECSVTYTIETWNKYGDSKTASKIINISNEHDIEINPDLILTEYTYEGHKEIAKDESTFVVDGIDYSASRTYAEGLARNTFKANSNTVSIKGIDSTKSECTFSQKGTCSVTLDIRADGGARASDSESIEVRKTPHIIDNLSGFQKQNRKQTLNITVATYPGKPLTDYTINLKDKVTGEIITLTPD
ncbi:MAG: hypothetical protein PHY15_08270, partial [Eubacteriales bacterium]|nr:hypothetical protein [Eubacteriales bacterium]